MKVLFVCGKNKLRSPTAESVFLGHPEIEALSVGLSKKAEVRLTVDHLKWSDIIFVMEKKFKNKIMEDYSDYVKDENVISLNIPDKYQYMDPELVSIFENRIPHILEIDKI